MYEIDFFAGYKTFLFQPRVFSRALGCGARRGAACTPRRKCRPRPDPVTCALGVQSCAIWRVIAGSLSAELGPTKPIETPKMCFFAFHFFSLSAAVPEKPQQPSKATRQPRYSSRASSFSL